MKKYHRQTQIILRTALAHSFLCRLHKDNDARSSLKKWRGVKPTPY